MRPIQSQNRAWRSNCEVGYASNSIDSVASSGSFTLPLRSRAAPSSQSISRLPPPLGSRRTEETYVQWFKQYVCRRCQRLFRAANPRLLAQQQAQIMCQRCDDQALTEFLSATQRGATQAAVVEHMAEASLQVLAAFPCLTR